MVEIRPTAWRAVLSQTADKSISFGLGYDRTIHILEFVENIKLGLGRFSFAFLLSRKKNEETFMAMGLCQGNVLKVVSLSPSDRSKNLH